MTRLRRPRPEPETADWSGGYTPYDLVKELSFAIGFVALLAVLLAVLLSSPDDPPSTVAQWARQQPVNFVAAAAQELAGTTGEEQTTGVPVGITPVGSFALGVVGNSHPAEVLNGKTVLSSSVWKGL